MGATFSRQEVSPLFSQLPVRSLLKRFPKDRTMTAINVIKQKNAVHMITDGASWIFDGGFGPACCKAWPIAHLHAVVSGRGPRLGPLLLADFLNTAGRTYDEMKKNAATIVGELYACHGESLIANPFGPKAEFVIAGWSESVGPDAFVISLQEGAWAGQDAGAVMMAPGDLGLQRAVLAAMPAGVTDAESMDAARDGLAIVQAQRAARSIENGAPVVGGFVQITTVTREAISTRILHSWPDEWGEPMVPPADVEAAA